MDGATALAAAVGLVAALAAVVVMWSIASGAITNLLVVRPAPGLSPVGRDVLRDAITAVAKEDRPWIVRPCPEQPRADFVGEWRLADARWWGLAQRNGLSVAYRAWFALDERHHELRCTEETTSIRWSAGVSGLVPTVSWGGSFFRGIILFERTKERAWGLKDEPPLAPGAVVAYDFDPWRIKGPIIRAALERGWAYRPVVRVGQLR